MSYAYKLIDIYIGKSFFKHQLIERCLFSKKDEHLLQNSNWVTKRNLPTFNTFLMRGTEYIARIVDVSLKMLSELRLLPDAICIFPFLLLSLLFEKILPSLHFAVGYLPYQNELRDVKSGFFWIEEPTGMHSYIQSNYIHFCAFLDVFPRLFSVSVWQGYH